MISLLIRQTLMQKKKYIYIYARTQRGKGSRNLGRGKYTVIDSRLVTLVLRGRGCGMWRKEGGRGKEGNRGNKHVYKSHLWKRYVCM